MGQYWYPVNLDKKEFIHPHKLGTGLKLWEQLANHPGIGAALIVLMAAMPEARGGGDFDLDANWHGPEREVPGKHNAGPGPMPTKYPAIAKAVIGRWAGDRVVLVGDYAKNGDLPKAKRRPGDLPFSKVFSACHPKTKEVVNDDSIGASYRNREGRYVHYVETAPAKFTDISEMVAKVIEHELNGEFVGFVGFVGDGWKDWKSKDPVGA